MPVGVGAQAEIVLRSPASPNSHQMLKTIDLRACGLPTDLVDSFPLGYPTPWSRPTKVEARVWRLDSSIQHQIRPRVFIHA